MSISQAQRATVCRGSCLFHTDLAPFPLHQSFSNLKVPGSRPGVSLKCRSGLSSSAMGPRFCISNTRPGGTADSAGQGLSRMVQGALNNTDLS